MPKNTSAGNPPAGQGGKVRILAASRYHGPERIRHTDRFDDPNLPGEMRTTVTFKKVSCGTELNVVQEGLPDVIPPRPAVSAGRNR